MATLAYQVFKQQVTHNGGITWEDVVPSVTIKIPMTGATCEAPWSARLIGHYSAKPSLEPCRAGDDCYGSESVLTDYYSNYPKGIDSIGNSLNKTKCIVPFGSKCNNLELVLTEDIKTISNNAFRNVFVGRLAFSGTPQLETIGDYAFYIDDNDQYYEYNSWLTHLKNSKRYFNIPDSLESIGNYAFKNRQISSGGYKPAEFVFGENSSIDTIGAAAFASKDGCIVRFNMPVPPSNISQDILGYSNRTAGGWAADDRADGFGIIIVPEQYVSAYKNVLTGLTYSILSETPLGDVGAVQLDGELIPCDATSSVTVDAQTIERWLKVGNQVKTINGRVPNRLIYLDLGNGLENIGDSVFTGLTSFESISFPNSLKTIGNSAFTNSKFDSIIIPSGVTSIGDYAFARCSNYVDVTINGGTIGTGAFSGGNISSLSLSGVTVIGDYAFCDTGYHFYDLIIPNTVVSIGEYAFRKASNAWYEDRICDFTGVTLSDSIKHIGDYAFATNHNLTVTFSGTPTLETIGTAVFSGKTLVNAEHLSLPNINTIGMSAFTNCTDIRDVSFGSGVTSIDYEAFVGCINLTAVTVDATTPPRLHRGWSNKLAFDGLSNYLIYVPCESYGDYISSDWGNYSGRIRMKEGCITPYPDFKLKLYYNNDQPAWVQRDNNTTLTTGNTHPSTFNYNSITGVEISNSVTSIGGEAFDHCGGLTQIDLPSGLTTIGDSGFCVCNRLTSITIPNTVTEVGRYAFYYCTSLTSATLSNNLYIIRSNSFRECTGLTSIVIPDSVYMIETNAFVNCKSLTSLTVGNGVEYIKDSAFAGCKSLTSVTLPSSVKQIGQGVFAGCSNLTAVTINATTPPALSGGALTGIFTIYVPCESLETYRTAYIWSDYAPRIKGIPPCEPPFEGKYKFTLSSSTVVSAECDSSSAITSAETTNYKDSIKYVEIGSCVTGISQYAFGTTYFEDEPYFNLVTVELSENINCIDDNAFAFASSLKYVKNLKASYIGNSAFNGCHGLTIVDLKDGVTSIGNEAFYGCESIENINIPNTVTNIGTSAFYQCYKLKNVTIGSGITSINNSTFMRCTGLTSVTIPNTVTNIGGSAFFICSGLTSLTIGSGVTNIDGDAFWFCKSLTNITCLAITPPTLGYQAFYQTNNCPIYVPSESVNAYKSASDWSDYVDRIQPIPT